MSRYLKPCGTRAAYVRHLSLNQAPCAPCTRANSTYEHARQHRAEQQAGINRDLRELIGILHGLMSAS